MTRRSLTYARNPLFALTLLGLLLGGRTVAAAPLAQAGKWWGDYFANPTLSGGPALSRYDDDVSFSWGDDSPAPGIPADNFSIRWVRDAWFASGTYHFTIYSDDGVRVWVGAKLVVDEWQDRWAVPLYIDTFIPEGTHRVQIEYYDHTGGATIGVSWDRLESGAVWHGEYFDNKELNGSPQLVRGDNVIDFDWGTGSPDPAIPADSFSVRWTRTMAFDTGTYRFFASTDDGARLWVDGGLVIDAWGDQSLPNTSTGDVYLVSGQHIVTIEYYEHGGDASAHVWWKSLESFTDWHGQYFDNADLTGGPAMERNDAEVDFNWGEAPPADWMPDDNFSVRWTRTVNFPSGYYRFALRADDGARLWLDERLLIDKWRDMDYELHFVDGTYLEGEYTIRLEYYEHTGSARVAMWWETSADSNSPPVVDQGPTDYHEPVSLRAGTGDVWRAAYFANAAMSGTPVLTRVERTLDHSWGWNSPGPGVPEDNFSVRWTRSLHLSAGTYIFTTYTDDGVRLWVDGRLVIDRWRPMRGTRSATVHLDGGIHYVRVDYFERTGIALARLTWLRLP